ncbi:TlpA disulfide reductase family protein [Alteromonas sp. 1_MG-2023]|uniref:TlpA family protein disulfide reductase n=1 Tax=Alteromonas sp. 1_MG-2023 TaxID=3062669 RepID=UPI0026E2D849|nr:TlpA disulfide reductase family protein [Alteromonas sp. 1_MG-2023]MDO6569113.1 TlpA disulfide reductase family protein [Alteromonas sp. 1_MG-2023]
MSNSMKQGLLIALVMLLSVTAGVWFYKYSQTDFETLQGEQYKWRDLKGDWVIINYFAPWCAPCLREMPELHQLNKNLPPKTHLFAINYDVLPVSDLQVMMNKFEITLNVIMANEETHLPISKPPYLPATYIIGPEGQVRAEILGEVTADILTDKIHELQSL